MPFHQPLFIFVFLPIAWLGYALLARTDRARGWVVRWLLLASILFYAFEDMSHLAVVACSILGNFAFAKRLQHCDDLVVRKRLLAVAIIANVALLVFYKARLSPWFAGNDHAAFQIDAAAFLIPLGLSFVTFEQICALMDVHRRRVKLGTFTEYSLFVTFFPHLVMGPIVAYRDLAPQLRPAAIRGPSARALAIGAFIFSIGLFKKSVLADQLAPYVNNVFSAVAGGGGVSTADAWLGAFAFTFQLYFDFSAYADMAIGLAFMFGIRLPINFDAPYRARNLFDAFMRWNITFVVFLRDYIMRPLSRQRLVAAPVGVAVLVTTVVSGLWHGLANTFLIFGLAMGALLLLFHAWTRFRRRRGWPEAPVFVQVTLTYLAIMMLMVSFRSPTVEAMGAYFRALVPHGSGGALQIDPVTASLMAACACVIWMLPTLVNWMGSQFPGFDSRTPDAPAPARGTPEFAIDWRWGVLVGGLLTLGVVMQGVATRFVYYQF